MGKTPCFQCEKLRYHGYLVKELRSCKLWSAAPPLKKKKTQVERSLWNGGKWLVLKSQVSLVYTQSTENGWCQYVGGGLPSSREAANMWCWVDDPDFTLPPTFSSVLIYWTIHSLTLYLHCLQHRSSVLWWFLASKFLWVEITGKQHKWKENSRSFKTFELLLCYLTAVWPWKISQTLRRRKWQPTPVVFLENPMDRGAWWATVHGS